MADNLIINASVIRGKLNIFFFKDDTLLNSLSIVNSNNSLNVALEDGNEYHVMYNVTATQDSCVYKVDITSPSSAETHIQIPLDKKGSKDFNAIPFHT